MKLSNSKEVLRLMAAGWELRGCLNGRYGSSVTLQENGLFRGGETISVHRSTLEAMLRRKEIRRADRREGDPSGLRRYERGGKQ